jgi:hypothetical protein
VGGGANDVVDLRRREPDRDGVLLVIRHDSTIADADDCLQACFSVAAAVATGDARPTRPVGEVRWRLA